MKLRNQWGEYLKSVPSFSVSKAKGKTRIHRRLKLCCESVAVLKNSNFSEVSLSCDTNSVSFLGDINCWQTVEVLRKLWGGYIVRRTEDYQLKQIICSCTVLNWCQISSLGTKKYEGYEGIKYRILACLDVSYLGNSVFLLPPVPNSLWSYTNTYLTDKKLQCFLHDSDGIQ